MNFSSKKKINMKIDDKVVCYNVINGKKNTINSNKNYPTFIVGEKYTITSMSIGYITLDYFISFPVRKHGSKKRTSEGVPIAYFDKFFITEKQYRKRKLEKLNLI
jgi:hypothetical protein